MNKHRVLRICFVIIPLVAILITASVRLPAHADVGSPAEMLQRAWRNAQAAGSYRFISDVSETLIPRPVPEMIGEQDTSIRLALDGAVLLPDRSYINLRLIGNGLSESATLLRDGAQSFMLQDGELKPVEDVLSLATPSNDLLGYLSGAQNVTAITPPENHPELARYSFELDGTRLEEYVRQQAEAALRAEPGAPEGLTLQPSPSLQKMSGRGELWVNAGGLPVRQVLDVDMPEVNAQYSARMHLVIDFSAHGQVEALPKAVQGADGTWHLEGSLAAVTRMAPAPSSGAAAPAEASAHADQATQTALATDWAARLHSSLPLRVAPDSLVLFILAVLAIAIVRYYRRNPRRCSTLIVSILIPILVLAPLLQAGKVVHFQDRQAQAAVASKAATPELLHALGVDAAAPDAGSAAHAQAKGDDSLATGLAKGDPVPTPAADLHLPSPPSNNATVQAQAGQSTSGMQRCGDGEPGVDTDADGLTDQAELCLGTSPYKADTDGDAIPDKTEVDGFDCYGKHWESDPLSVDTNGDGALDTMEWSEELTPNGLALSVDIDQNGIPNLWDEDDDGDGVPDAQDLSPFAKSELTTSLSLSTEGSGFSGYEYIEVQVRPQEEAHLRYSTTALDWPPDDKGNIQDLDLSTQDLRLTPFLFVTTNVAPPADLAQKYGVASWRNGNEYVLLVTLQPMGDGGEVSSFYAKVAYAPGQTTDIQWQARVVWMAQMQADIMLYPYFRVFKTEMRLLHEYQDTFRLTGLKVTKEQGYEAAVLGTPSYVDDLRLFKILLGLNDTFKSHVRLEGQEPGETALQEIAQRFAPGSTATITHTFGVEASAVAMSGPTQYQHTDAALAGTGADLVPDFFDSYDVYYGRKRCADAQGNPLSCAALILAYEQTLGARDLQGLPSIGVGVADLSKLHVNLASVPLVTNRGIQMRMYEQGADGWQVVTPARMLELVEARYAGTYDTALRDLFPNLTTDSLRFITYSAYLWATSPYYAAIVVDGQPVVPDVADEAQLALNRALPPGEEAQADTAVNWFALGTGIASALGVTAVSFIWAFSDFNAFLNDLLGKWKVSKWQNTVGAGWQGLGVGLFLASTTASTIMGIINTICTSESDTPMCRNTDALKWANVGVNALAIVYQAQWVTQMIIDGIRGTLEAVSNVALGCQAVGMVVGILLAWAAFGMAAATAGGDPITWRLVLAQTIVSTIWMIFLFVLNFIPIIGQVISAILALIDMLLSFFTGLFGDKTWSVVTLIVGLFYDIRILTTLQEAAFGELSSSLQDPNAGLVGGNIFRLSIPASAVMGLVDYGYSIPSDLQNSWAEGRLTWQWPKYDQSTMFTATDESQPRHLVHDWGVEARWGNTATLAYALTPKINGLVSYQGRIVYQYVWGEFGSYNTARWSTKTDQATAPEDADSTAPSKLYLDVLPSTLTDLWNWSELTNPDRDGDGLTNVEETAQGTNPDLWDKDGDGLSDYYEWLTSADHGANPLLADTDGDGLNDGLEWRLGTRIDVADTDGDGLSDGEEVRRLEGGVFVGGWPVTLPGAGTVWISSDPLQPDADGDGLNDAEEKAHGLSPWAANSPVPALTLSAAPVRGLPGGRAGTYWGTGETVSFTIRLANYTSAAVTTTLTLDLPGWFDSIQGGTMQGDRTPPLVQSGGQLSWSFTGSNKLQLYEVVSTTVTARIGATSAHSEIVVGLPYGDLELRKTLNVVVDGDYPNVSLQAPANGAFLRGTTLVVGGSATDRTTWVTGAELSIVHQLDAPSFQPLTGTLSPWAYTWSLPADGVYTLQARATDAMGHQSTTAAVNVTVDNTSPAATLGYAMDGSNVHLSGTATDNLSGVQWVQLSIDGQPWHSVTLNGSAWSDDWTVGVGAQGTHVAKLVALDRSGNQSEIITAEILVDRVAPSSDVSGGADPDVPPAVKPSTAFTLTGVADEGGHLPLPAVPPDLKMGMDVFADSTVWLGLSSIRDNDGGVLAAWAGDFDSDRMADLAVGLPGPSGDAGRVAILYGRAGGWPVAPNLEMLADSPTRFLGTSGVQLGSYLAAAGDTNSDNFSDLLIGERASTRAFLIFGHPGAVGEVTLDGGHSGYRTLLQAPATIQGLATAGDVNGDGYADLLIRAGGTAYLVFGRAGPWPETVDVAAEAAATFSGVTGALGVGDVNGDQLAEWVTMIPGEVKLYRWDDSSKSVQPVTTVATADSSPRVAALGDVDGDGRADWLYSNGTSRTLVYGSGASPHTFSGYDGLFAAPGDVDGDGRSDILLVNAAGVASLIRQQAGESPEVLATVSGVGGAANSPYAAGADLNADGSAELLLIPSQAAAEARGFDAPDFSSGFISPQALPLGVSSGSAGDVTEERTALQAGLLSTGPDTRYVDDDGGCDGHSPCLTTIQDAVNASDGGGDTIIVYPGVYAPFTVPAGANYDHLTVQGVSADAAFVQGSPDAIHVAADGVLVSNLTVRNATAGIVLEAGAGEPTVAGGSETFINHVVAHSVQYPISMTQASALTLSDSTLVGNGTNPLIRVNPASNPAVLTWHEDRAVATPATPSKQPVTKNGGVAGTAGTLYAMPGGTNRTVYAATPGTGGALGAWSAVFQLPHEMPADAGKSMITAGGGYFYQVQTAFKAPDFGVSNGAIRAVATAANGDVYAGGSFTQIGGVAVNNIARWDGTQWNRLGTELSNGISGTVYALTVVSNGDLYVGGHFNRVFDGTGVPALNIARWNGSAWLTLGESVAGGNGVWGDPAVGLSEDDVAVYALTHTDDDVVAVGGRFRHCQESQGGTVYDVHDCTNFAFYNPAAQSPDPCWQPVADHLHGVGDYHNPGGYVSSLVWGGGTWWGTTVPYSAPGKLYAGGSFTITGYYAAHNIGVFQYNSCCGGIEMWHAIGGGITTTVADVAVDTAGKVYAVSDDAAAKGVYVWDGSAWSWTWTVQGPGGALAADARGNVYAAMFDGKVYVLPDGWSSRGDLDSDGETTRVWDLFVESPGQVLAARGDAASGGVRRWVVDGLLQRDLSAGSWEWLSSPAPTANWYMRYLPLGMTVDGDGDLYGLWGNSMDGRLWRLDATSKTWIERANPEPNFYYSGLVWAGGKVYALAHSDLPSGEVWYLYQYDPASNVWTQIGSAPLPNGASSGNNLSLAWDGADCIYAQAASGFYRYRLSDNAWDTLPAPSVSFTISQAPALVRVGSYLYVYATPGTGVTTNLFRYGAVGTPDLRLTVDRTAFVVPDAAASFAWTNLSAASGTYRFRTDIDTTNAWVGPSSATWSPPLPLGATTLTSAQAAFVAPADGLYRLGATSTLSVGYHHYKAVAHVYPSQAACSECSSGTLTWGDTAFATVREAVESGAARVLVHPGRYPQSFYLVSGVDVIGSGAETTIIEPPAGTAATLVTAEGVAYSSLSRVTLAGGAGWQGFLAEGGARGLRLSRNIIRDLSTGVRLRGGSEVEVVNNTIVRNGTGFLAETNNPVNVRNTIFAYNTDSGLQRIGTPTSLANNYNDFWGNGTPMIPADVGGGKLFRDPRFQNLAGNNLRLAADSPLIDMGAPNDPTPPGAGTRVDIGYAEYNAASFYVSHDYSETGLNDGLMWGVDAFDTVQAGLDAAADALHSLQGTLPEGGYTVGVDSGTFTEMVTVPSHVRLVGSGAAVTTVDAGNAGSAVTFDAVIDAEVAGMTLRNASASGAGVDIKNSASGITIARNVIVGNAGHGISLAQSSSGIVSFNTLVSNTGAGVYATGAGTWAAVRNSILDGNALGLQAASGALIRNDYNLLHNTTNVDGVTAGANTILADPAFAPAGHYVPTAASPAVDAADPLAEVPPGGGVRADLGYKELVASPLTLVFGPQVESTVTGNSGVQKVEVGLTLVSDATQPVTATLPSTWQTLTPATTGEPLFFWSQSQSLGTPGYYRVYSRATDVAGNREENESDWYEGALVVDNTAPTVTWGTPALGITTDAAAVLAVAQASGEVSTGTGTRSDVRQLYFGVPGPSGTVTYTAEAGRAWIRLPVVASYAIIAVAVDEAGNQAETMAGVNVSASGSVATATEPPDGSAVADRAVTLRGYVRFAGSGFGVVRVGVGGGNTVQAALESPGAAFSAWSADITLPAGEGAKTVTITPTVGGTVGIVKTLGLTLDSTAPSLSITTPAPGSVVTQTVTFAGSASDGGSGVEQVDVSLDGGFTWQPAELSAGNWSLDCELKKFRDYVSYPARVRATDAAGNVTVVERPVVADGMPPTGLPPVTFDQPVGQHLNIGSYLSIAWNVPVDAGGPVKVLLAVDRTSTTVPSQQVSGTSSSARLVVVGDWYVHLMAQDAKGNQALYHYGPWHVRDMANSTFSARRQSILVDGFIDLDHNEWLPGDLLGTDAQGLETQQLYASWDGQAIYLAWSGAWWTLDGAMWAYLDVDGTSGSMQSVGGAHTLPISADLAVWIDSPEEGSLYTWNGSGWVLSGSPLDFSQGPSGDTEARIPYSLAGGQTVELVAFALPREEPAATQATSEGRARIAAADDAGQPWAIFPNTNPLGGSPVVPYVWTAPDTVQNMNDGQPTARTVTLQVSSPQAGGMAGCPLSTVQYDILLQNPEENAIAGLTLILTPTAGLNYASVSGATYVPTPGCWTFNVPTLGADASQSVVVSATLASDLSSLAAVTTTIHLSAGATALTGSPVVELSHQVDGQAPTVTLDSLPGGAIAPSSHLFTGTADDGAGSGVAAVAVSADGGATWQPAAGTLDWSALLPTPASGTFTLQARAVDHCGYTSTVASHVYNVDTTNPGISWAIPSVITATAALLNGTAWDPQPAGALVAQVDVQLDSETASWFTAVGPGQPQGGVQPWWWTWNTPQDDGVQHTLRARALDGVGKLADTGWQTTVVDVVAPQITVTAHLDNVTVPDDPLATALAGRQSPDWWAREGGVAQRVSVMALAATPVLTGTVTDGAGVQAMRVLVYDPLGGTATAEATLANGSWVYAPDLAGWAEGTYALRVQAVDIHGNTSMRGPYLLDLQEAPITGLTATNNGPCQVGQTVTLTATITGGSNVTYTWALGDGGTASGPVVTHAYAGGGAYTAIVTATNSASTSSAQTTVTILSLSVEAGADQQADEGAPVSVAATFSGGPEGVTYTAAIDWGDSTAPTAGTVDETAFTISGSHAYGDNGTYVVTVTLNAGGGTTSSDMLQVTVSNVAPVVSAAPASQTIEYGHLIAPITFTATDVATDTMTAALTSAPAGLALGTSSCSASAGVRTCTWEVTGSPNVISGTYTVRGTVTDKDGGSGYADAVVTLGLRNASVFFADENPVAVKVATSNNPSGPFDLKACVGDADPATPGDINLAQVSMTLVPVGPGSPVAGTAGTPTVADGLKCVTFSFSGVPVNTYSVQVTVGGGHYTGAGEDVLVVYDPSLGFTVGGGWFYWPGTANEGTGYPGDRTDFGYTMAYGQGATNVQGNLLLIRHLANGTIYLVMSNALNGLALGQDTAIPMGWASFSGMSTYLEPGWPQPQGNYPFTVYVEDRNGPGTGVDRFWIEVVGGLSLPRQAAANAQPIAGGNIVVPHTNPTGVDLLRLEAWQGGPQTIHVQWETSQEINSVGFNLYRSDSLSGARILLNETLIPTLSPGSPFGAVYDWIDRFQPGLRRTCYYWLEDVDIYGHTTLHGPVKVTLR